MSGIEDLSSEGLCSVLIGEELKVKVLSICHEIADKSACHVAAACFYGSRVSGHARKSSDLDVLLILEPYQEGILYHYKPLDDITVSVLAVDKKLFEGDVEQSQLGEFVVGRLLTPYEPYMAAGYLNTKEVQFKERSINESLQDLISEYPKIIRELRIAPEFFIFYKMGKRAQVYPPVKYSYQRMFEGTLRELNVKRIMTGYLEAIKRLVETGFIKYDGKFVMLNEDAVTSLRKEKLSIVKVAKNVERAARSYIVHGYAGRTVNPIAVAQEFASKLLREVEDQGKMAEMDEPEKYLYLPSTTGFQSLSDRVSIEKLPEKVEPLKGFKKIDVVKLGGAINFVYLIKLSREEEERWVVVKKYKDWHGFKWFPLALWTLGVQSFALRGKSRMANEYSALLHLRKLGFPVPEVIYINWGDRLLFTEYVDGRSLEDLIREVFTHPETVNTETEIIRSVGNALAEIHGKDMVLGDPKPENIVIDRTGRIYFLDLEQAVKHGGDPAWDLAECLYYTGRFTLSSQKAKEFTTAFLQGYLEKGAEEVVKRVTKPKYVRVFAVVTPPQVIHAITKTCNDAVCA